MIPLSIQTFKMIDYYEWLGIVFQYVLAKFNFMYTIIKKQMYKYKSIYFCIIFTVRQTLLLLFLKACLKLNIRLFGAFYDRSLELYFYLLEENFLSWEVFIKNRIPLRQLLEFIFDLKVCQGLLRRPVWLIFL